MGTLLQVKNLKTYFNIISGVVKAVNRGERRRILEVVVESDGKNESLNFKQGDPDSMNPARVRTSNRGIAKVFFTGRLMCCLLLHCVTSAPSVDLLPRAGRKRHGPIDLACLPSSPDELGS